MLLAIVGVLFKLINEPVIVHSVEHLLARTKVSFFSNNYVIDILGFVEQVSRCYEN